jgi:excisionase family DNA binding protein
MMSKDTALTEATAKELVSQLASVAAELKALRELLVTYTLPSQQREFLTLQEASELCGLSSRQLREYIRQGVLTRYGSSRRILISRTELEEAIKNGFKQAFEPSPVHGKIKPIKVKVPRLKK